MPELPEVEIVRRQIEETLVGQRLGRAEVRQPKVVIGDLRVTQGMRVRRASRQGKYLFVHLERGVGLAVHLKMTGRIIISNHDLGITNQEEQTDYNQAPHTRVVIELSGGSKLYYWDTRMFGYIRVEEDIALAEERIKNKLGPDPWEMSDKEFLAKLQKTGRAIKNVLLDQQIIAGVGNIYANDALYLAGVDPRISAQKITPPRCKKILRAVRQVMERSLSVGGASDNTYRDFYGGRGRYQDEFLVYGKTGGVCPQCGSKLEYTKIGGRGTWICPKEQR